MGVNPQAEQLNATIRASGAAILDMFSMRGRGMYFPRQGILAQSAEAQGRRINATIGTALEEDGAPMSLPCIAGQVKLDVGSIVAYAPSFGQPALRQIWRKMMLQKNPSLSDKSFSLPVVTSALTHGLYLCGCLFCDPGDTVLLPDMHWENYELIFNLTWGARLETYPAFAGDGFNVAGFAEKLRKHRSGRLVVLLNFPNNPSGYTPTPEEAYRLRDELLAASERGLKIVVLVDDAYFGLVFEEGILRESLFALLCDLHPNLLAVKLDGATKEDYVWGFRVGFITYGIAQAQPELYKALEAKTAGAIRASTSNCSQLAQSLLAKAYFAPDYAIDKQAKYELLRKRYLEVRRILTVHPEYASQFTPMPFNSGYFMCLKMRRVDPESLRQKLVADYSTGVVSMNGVVRLAFSSVPCAQLEELFDNIYRAALELDQAGAAS
ncbi:MAG: aminotransferase class I/II-fold pyridoxal phosphate-dependent enzyme [Kiritimatiellia bacterium]|jgi:aspartate/methionine/tyrosine aminotransferase